jgi:hypothetical protein
MTDERPGWTYCPRCGMHVPDPIFAEFCGPMLAESTA